MPALKPLARTAGLLVEHIDAETVVYDTQNHNVYALSPSASAVWAACNGERTIQDLAQILSPETPTNEAAVWHALKQLSHLIEEPVKPPREFANLSRRELLRTGGLLAAGLTVPFVTKLVAPSAKMQISGCAGEC